MTSEYPPELKGFHARNMGQAFLVFLIPAAAGGWALYRQEALAADDRLQAALGWIFLAGTGIFVITILFKALAALPKCPHCHGKMEGRETIAIPKTHLPNIKSHDRWRIVECPHCELRYRIPGLSTE